MRRISGLVAVLLFSTFCLRASGQSNEPATGKGRHAQNQQTAAPTFRPRLLMRDALKVAESYIGLQHIDISRYWLYRSTFMVLGDEQSAGSNKVQGWHFWWVSDTGAMGDYVEIFVAMDGKASRMPSM